MREINVTPKTILLEPIGKGTAPAITLAALKAIESSKNPYLLILSSDHFIKNQSNFINCIEEGLKYAKEGRLVTFGFYLILQKQVMDISNQSFLI